MDDEEKTVFLHDGRTPRRSRTSHKRERVSNEEALSVLVQALRDLSPGHWRALDVPEAVREVLEVASKIKSYAALERHLRRIRSLLRDTDWQQLLRRVDLLQAGFALNQEAPPAVVDWTNRLLIQGDPALRLFLESFPDADRRRIRQLMQNVKRAPDARRAKARFVLETAVHHVVKAFEEELRRQGSLGGHGFDEREEEEPELLFLGSRERDEEE